MKNCDEVVLNFAYKDCLLKGAQRKDDDKGKEILFNEILASSEIDVLLSPKALWKFELIERENVQSSDSLHLLSGDSSDDKVKVSNPSNSNVKIIDMLTRKVSKDLSEISGLCEGNEEIEVEPSLTKRDEALPEISPNTEYLKASSGGWGVARGIRERLRVCLQLRWQSPKQNSSPLSP